MTVGNLQDLDTATALGFAAAGDALRLVSDEIAFDTVAAVQAASVPAHVNALDVLGYATRGDGGRASYTRTAAEPAHGGKIQSGDGAWWVLIPDPPGANPKQFGAKGDAVQNPATGAWTGTDDTTALRTWNNACDLIGCANFLGAGFYIFSAHITRDDGLGLQFGSNNVLWHGLGDRSKLIVKAREAGAIAYGIGYGGLADEINSTTVYPTAAVSVGDYQITVNSTASLYVGEWFELIDHSQDVIDNNTGTGVAKVGFAARVVSIDDATHVTMDRRAEFALTANAGAPLTATTLRRFTAPARNIAFRDFTVEFDPTFTYTTTHRTFFMYRCLGVQHDGLIFRKSQWYEFGVAETIIHGGTNYLSERGNAPNDYATYTLTSNGSHFGQYTKLRQIGGRHLTDGSSYSVNGLEDSHCFWGDLEATGSTGSPFNCHTGVRNWTWDGIKGVSVAVDTLTTPLNVGGAGAQIRGRFCAVRNYDLTAFVTGIYAVHGSNVTIGDGVIDTCYDAFNFAKCPNVTVDGRVLVRSPRNSVLQLQNSPGLSTNWTVRGVRVEGNPATSVIVNNSADDPTWNFQIEAPNATTFLTGTAISEARLGWADTGGLKVDRVTNWATGIKIRLTPALDNGSVVDTVVPMPGGTATKGGRVFQTLGEGDYQFRINGYIAFRVESYPSAVNYPSIYASPAGLNPTLHPIQGIGGDANQGFDIKGLGTKGGRLLDGAGTARVETNTTGIGFNNVAPIAKPALNAAATDLPTAIALTNQIRAALIAYGLNI